MFPERFYRAYALGCFPTPLTGLESRRRKTGATRRRGSGMYKRQAGAGNDRPPRGACYVGREPGAYCCDAGEAA